MTYISDALRRLVIERAQHCCEYCLLSDEDSFLPFEIDHIIAEKHGGQLRKVIFVTVALIAIASKGATSVLVIPKLKN